MVNITELITNYSIDQGVDSAEVKVSCGPWYESQQWHLKIVLQATGAPCKIELIAF